MIRRVFFSFHYEEDIWRAHKVRSSWAAQDWKPITPLDFAAWEALKRNGSDEALRWIDRQIDRSSVTVVLIGARTSTRALVKYEIQKSAELDKGILGVRIHALKNQYGQTSSRGPNPLEDAGKIVPLFAGSASLVCRKVSDIFKTYDYVTDGGEDNLTVWVEEAAKIADSLDNKYPSNQFHEHTS